VKFLPKSKSPEKKEAATEKKELAMPEKKEEMMPAGKRRTPTTLMPYTSSSLWRDFDRIFHNFRSDFEDLMWPSTRPLVRALSRMPDLEVRVPYVDLEDRGKDYLLKAEMPGFKKEDIELHVRGDSVEINAVTGWKYDDKTKRYICKERACESFYRIVELPEEIKTEKVEANLKDGVLEITLPKKTPKIKKRVAVK
jgi:HSP20 family protein